MELISEVETLKSNNGNLLKLNKTLISKVKEIEKMNVELENENISLRILLERHLKITSTFDRAFENLKRPIRVGFYSINYCFYQNDII